MTENWTELNYELNVYWESKIKWGPAENVLAHWELDFIFFFPTLWWKFVALCEWKNFEMQQNEWQQN